MGATTNDQDDYNRRTYARVLATEASADILRCKIEGYNHDIFITTSPDTNQNDGQYARIGISRGIGNKAFVVTDRMGAVAFVELNADGTPIGLLTVQKNTRVIKSTHPIDPSGMVLAPSQSAGLREQRAGGQKLQQAATADGVHMMRRHGRLPKRADFVAPQSVDTRSVRSMKRVQSGRALI